MKSVESKPKKDTDLAGFSGEVRDNVASSEEQGRLPVLPIMGNLKGDFVAFLEPFLQAMGAEKVTFHD